jgi:CheY-like chemotaxis protein
MLVDDQNLVRKGVRSLLELADDMEVIAEAPDGIEAIRTIPEIKPDVVLLDMRMPGKSGLDVLEQLSSDGTLPPTIILTTFDDDEMVLAGIKAGAKGYLLKDVTSEALIEAIRGTIKGESLIDASVARKVLDDVVEFDWYRNGRTAIFSRQLGSETELRAINFETGREELLFVGPLMEFDVAPDGSAVSFCYGRSHLGMGLALLRLNPPSDPVGLPTAVGEPDYAVPTEGTWHVHNGGWSPDSKMLIYTRDQDYGNIYELVERQ